MIDDIRDIKRLKWEICNHIDNLEEHVLKM